MITSLYLIVIKLIEWFLSEELKCRTSNTCNTATCGASRKIILSNIISTMVSSGSRFSTFLRT